MATIYWEMATEFGTETVDRWLRESKKKALASYRDQNKNLWPYRTCKHCHQLLVRNSPAYHDGKHTTCF